MAAFFLAFLQRICSGLQSMFGYAKEKTGFILGTMTMALFPFLFFKPTILFVAYAIVNLLIVYMKAMSFKVLPKWRFLSKYTDIHLWEDLLTGGCIVYMTLAGYNILLLCLSVYPALILHKGFINIGSKLPFFAEATDDATGKTYGFKLLNIKIARSTTGARILLASLSIIALILLWIFGVPAWHF